MIFFTFPHLSTCMRRVSLTYKNYQLKYVASVGAAVIRASVRSEKFYQPWFNGFAVIAYRSGNIDRQQKKCSVVSDVYGIVVHEARQAPHSKAYYTWN